jgi:soluble lytic murein transglycosylase
MDQRFIATPDCSGTRDCSRKRTRKRLSLLAIAVIAFAMPGAAAADHRHGPAKQSAKTDHGGHKGHAAGGARRQDAKHQDTKHQDARRQDVRRGARHAGRHDHKDHDRSDRDRKDAHAAPVPSRRPAADAAETGPAVAVPAELASTHEAIELIRQNRFSEASALARTIGDPLAQKVVEWALLRHPDSEAGIARYTAFIRANPDWPGIALMRRLIEQKVWQEHQDLHDAAAVRRLVGDQPATAAGRLALAHAEMREGDRASAEKRVRAVWRSAELSPDLEQVILTTFPGVLTRADHVARMDRRIGAREFGAATRAAQRVDSDHVAIVKACSNAGSKSFDNVPAGVRSNLGYALCRLHWLLRNDMPGANVTGRAVTPKTDLQAAARLVMAASPEDLERQDTDEWWRQRRLLARKLLDAGDPQTAYRVVLNAAAPANPYYRADSHFMPGWIALRFLNDPVTAQHHFARVDEGSADPVVLSRAAYWRGRAAEAAGRVREMRAQYQQAARFPTAYYGQLARARLGLGELASLRPPPDHAPDVAGELVRAAQILYKIGERGLVRSFVTDLAEENGNAATLAAVGQLTAQHDDAQSMLLMGRTALARGMALDQYAFPATGVPMAYGSANGPGKLDRCIVYSIVRTESSFDQRDKSAAKAVGLMQVTPTAGRDTAKRFHLTYDWNRLVSDPVYNTEMGAAEIAALLQDYRGSYVLTFAGYNAGRGRVQQWVAQHGDPRDPKVDAVDWVERIPFSETRNYVQRVMENLQVYHARFGTTMATVEPNLHRAATVE